MKIATNINRDAFGGITISNLALFDWLKDGNDTIVGIEYITLRSFLGSTIFNHYLPSFFSHHIVNAIDIIPIYPWETTYNLKTRWRILIEATKEILIQKSPDIVLINGTYFVPWILAQAASELKIPIILRYAGVLKKEVEQKNYFIRHRLLAYEQFIVSVAQNVIFPSALCKKVVETEVTQSIIKAGTVIYNPVNQIVIGRKVSKTLSAYSIAIVGRWTPIKNFPAFLNLHQDLKSVAFPHRAIIVTSYWDKKITIPKTIERQNTMSQDELQIFYRSIDLLVVPSHFETFCNVAAEAIINGTSVLVSENVGFAEVLKSAGLGRMVIESFDDPALVASAVIRLSKTKLTKTEQNRIAKIVSPQKIHEKIIELLEKAVF